MDKLLYYGKHLARDFIVLAASFLVVIISLCILYKYAAFMKRRYVEHACYVL
jgi:hypothetical protein